MAANKNKLENFYCEKCDYNTSKKSNFDAHLFTRKHLNANFGLIKANKNFMCENCNAQFSHQSSCCRHKKKCQKNNMLEKFQAFQANQSNEKELILMLIEQNSKLIEQNVTLVKNGINNTTTNSHNNHSNNKTFNLQFFLNETCKNAMNIMDFVDSLQLQLSDLENVGQLGYIEGISNIIIKNLNALDVSERPIHCTDKKRETIYVKDEDKWEKEDENKVKMHKMIKKVANKNIHLITEFREKYPDYKKCASKTSDKFNKIIIESMGGNGDNEYEKEEKIIKKVAKEIIVDK